MFCGNCGTENPNGAKFCGGCGKPLGTAPEVKKIVPPQVNTGAEANTTPNAGTEANTTPNAGAEANTAPAVGIENNTMPNTARPVGKQATGKKAIPKKILIGGCAAAAVVVIAIVAIAFVIINMRSTINLDNYVTIEASGYDGYGSIRATIDWDAIEEKYDDKISFTNAAKSEFGGLLTYMTPTDALKEGVRIYLEPNYGLSNGDTVTYTWDIDEDLSKYLKFKIKYKDGSYTVSGLTAVGTFDAFADLTVEFTGVSPNGSANLNYTGSEINYYDFICDKTDGLSNGDTVKVTIDSSMLEYYAENLGMVPEVLEKEYTVEGLESYLSTLAEVDSGSLETMKQQASDVFNAHAAQNWGEGEYLETFTYIGDYLLTSKSSDSYWGGYNTLYLVYKAQVRNSYSNEGQSYDKVNDVYWYISFSDLMVKSDGTLNVDVTSYDTPRDRFSIDSGISSGWWSTKSWEYYGYQTLDSLYKTVVASNMDSYNHEDNVDESAAPVTVPAEEQGEIIAPGSFIIPNSDTVLLTKADLENLTAEQCKIARNEIYARHGRRFRDEALQAYFDACDWYQGTIEPDAFDESVLSDVERANGATISEFEKEKGYN